MRILRLSYSSVIQPHRVRQYQVAILLEHWCLAHALCLCQKVDDIVRRSDSVLGRKSSKNAIQVQIDLIEIRPSSRINFSNTWASQFLNQMRESRLVFGFDEFRGHRIDGLCKAVWAIGAWCYVWGRVWDYQSLKSLRVDQFFARIKCKAYFYWQKKQRVSWYMGKLFAPKQN